MYAVILPLCLALLPFCSAESISSTPAIEMSEEGRDLYAPYPPGKIYNIQTVYEITAPTGVALGFFRNDYGTFVSSSARDCIFFIDQITQSTELVAGTIDNPGSVDAQFNFAKFNDPTRMAYDLDFGSLFVADKKTGKVRILTFHDEQVHTMKTSAGVEVTFATGVQSGGIFPGMDVQIGGNSLFITDTLSLYSVTSSSGLAGLATAAVVTKYQSLNNYMTIHNYPQTATDGSYVYSVCPDVARNRLYVAISFSKNVILNVPIGSTAASSSNRISVLAGDESKTFHMCYQCGDAPSAKNGNFAGNSANIELAFPMHLRYSKLIDSLFISETYPVFSDPAFLWGSQTIRRIDLRSSTIETYVGSDFSINQAGYGVTGTLGGYKDGEASVVEFSYPISIDVTQDVDNDGFPQIAIADLDNNAVRGGQILRVPTSQPTRRVTIAPTTREQFFTAAPTTTSQFATATPTTTNQFVTSTPTTKSQFSSAAPTAPSQFFTNAPTQPSQHVTNAPTAPSQFLTSAPTSPSQFVTNAPTTSSQFNTAAPSVAEVVSTGSPTTTSQFVTNAPTTVNQFSTSAPTTESQFVTSVPTTTSQFATGAPSQAAVTLPPTPTAAFVTTAPSAPSQFFTNAPTAPSQFVTNVPTLTNQFLTSSPTTDGGFVSEAPTTVAQFSTSAPTLTSQFVTSAPTTVSQFLTGVPTVQDQFSTPSPSSEPVSLPPTKAADFFTSAPTTTNQFITAAPSRDNAFVTQAPTTSDQFATPSPTRAVTSASPTPIDQFVTEAPTTVSQFRTSAPTTVDQFFTASPTTSDQFATGVPTTVDQFSTARPTRTDEFFTSAPTTVDQFATSCPTTVDQFVTSVPTTVDQFRTQRPTVFVSVAPTAELNSIQGDNEQVMLIGGQLFISVIIVGSCLCCCLLAYLLLLLLGLLKRDNKKEKEWDSAQAGDGDLEQIPNSHHELLAAIQNTMEAAAENGSDSENTSNPMFQEMETADSAIGSTGGGDGDSSVASSAV